MNDRIKIIALVGSYRKGGVVDRVVDEIIASARQEGAEVNKIYLLDQHIEFCSNCRTCTQQEGEQPGECVIEDDMRSLLDEIARSDAIVLGSPMNVGTVTAVTKRFMERLVCLAYWPWGAMAPKVRNKTKSRRAVIVTSSAAPTCMGRLLTNIVGILKQAVGFMGAKTVGVLYVGLAAEEKKPELGARTIKKAHRLGKKLTSAKL